MKISFKLFNTHVIAAAVLAIALPASAHSSSEGTFTPQRPLDSHFAAVDIPTSDQNVPDSRADRHDQSENTVKVTQQGFQQNAGRNTLDPLEPDYVWWQ